MRYLLALTLLTVAAVATAAEPPRAWAATPPRAGCSCGDSCACKPGTCPGSCPVAKPDEVAVSTTGRTLHRFGAVWTFAGDKPAPVAAAPVVVGYTFTKVCNGGTCQIVKTPVYAK